MTDPFFDILLESRVIVDNEEAALYFPRFIDDNSRLEKNIEKRIRHALENVLGLKQGAFYALASAAGREIVSIKLLQHRL